MEREKVDNNAPYWNYFRGIFCHIDAPLPGLPFVPPLKNVVGWAIWVFGLRQYAPKVRRFAGDS